MTSVLLLQVMEQYVGQEAEEGGRSKVGGGPPAPHPRSSKPPVEDRALQAILAARRRSLENAGKAEPVGECVGDGWVVCRYVDDG